MGGSGTTAVSNSRRHWYAAALCLALPLAWLVFRAPARGDAAEAGAPFHTVAESNMIVRVVKDGELRAVNNVDVRCLVEGRNTLVYVVKEGSAVKKGELLVEIDSAAIRQQLVEATLARQQARTDLKAAEEFLAIQGGQNDADLQAARVQLELANIALEQFTDGTYPQQVAAATTAVRMAQITVRNKEEDLEQTKKLFARGFVTAADVKKAELDLTTVRNTLAEAETALKVLTDYTRRLELATRQSAVTQAEQAVARVRKSNASLLSKAESDVEVKKIALVTKTSTVSKLEQQLAHCKIVAPADGIAVHVEDDDDWRVAEGWLARERQRLIQLPDTSRMKALVNVSETHAARLRPGQPAMIQVTGVATPLPATVANVSPVADGDGDRSVKEYPVELLLEPTSLALRPGMSVMAEIHAERLNNVLAVPLVSVYSHEKDTWVFRADGGRVTPTQVKLGSTSETHAHVTQGLKPGDRVLLLRPGEGRERLERGT